MKFNEKLIELRKKEGWSQEELGYKLNVSRQTVSKWELGQTTPDMDNIIQISNIFNISVNELINSKEEKEELENKEETETEVIEENNTKKKKKNKGLLITIIIIIVIIYSIGKVGEFIKIKIIDKVLEGMSITKILETTDKISNEIRDEEYPNEIDLEKLNLIYEEEKRQIQQICQTYSGEQKGIVLRYFLNMLQTMNQKDTVTFSINYDGIIAKSNQEIEEIKNKIDNSKKYIIKLDYSGENTISGIKIINKDM